MGDDLFRAIEEKHGFKIPSEYIRMAEEGLLDHKYNRENYLWIPEAEWMPAQEILDYEPDPDYRPGLIPFASSGAGDLWCWWPSEDPQAVVQCIQDEGMGRFDAPKLIASIYRRILEYAADVVEGDEEHEVRARLRDWPLRLQHYFPPSWIDHLTLLADAPVIDWYYGKNIRPFHGLISHEEKQAVIAREFKFPRLDERFEWMIEPNGGTGLLFEEDERAP